MLTPEKLTDAQIQEIWSEKDTDLSSSALTPFGFDRLRAIEAAVTAKWEAMLKGEPVGYLWPTGMHPEFRYTKQQRDGVEGTPVFTHPTVRPVQEPVAWMFEFPDKRVAPKFDSAPHGGNWKPLYTHPPVQPAQQDNTELLRQALEALETRDVRLHEAAAARIKEALHDH